MLTLANQTIFLHINFNFFIPFAIENVVLKAKYQVVDNGDEGEDNFGDIESVLDWETSAGHRAYTSNQIEDDAWNWPSFCTFSFVVPVDWGGVPDAGYEQFAVAQNCQGIPVLEVANYVSCVKEGLYHLEKPDCDDNQHRIDGQTVFAFLPLLGITL